MFLFAGISFAFMISGFFFEDKPSTKEDKHDDWIGAALVTASLVLVMFVLSDDPTARKGWKILVIPPPMVCIFSGFITDLTE
jgi:hypothetical protein